MIWPTGGRWRSSSGDVIGIQGGWKGQKGLLNVEIDCILGDTRRT